LEIGENKIAWSDMQYLRVWKHAFGQMVNNIHKVLCQLLRHYHLTLGNTDSTGVWVHSTTEEDIGYFSHKWDCSYEADVVHSGGDAFELCFVEDLIGAWCDIPKSDIRAFICEAYI